MPFSTRIKARLGVYMNPEQLRVIRYPGLRRVYVKLAKATSECLELREVEMLVAEENDLVQEQRFAHSPVHVLVEGTREIHSVHFRSDNGSERLDSNRVGGHVSC